MAYENNDKKIESVYSNRVKAGKRRTYFFDVRETRGNDFFLTITESRKRFDSDGYDRHKIFVYKEDFNKFLAGLTESINHVKTELMPDFDFDSFKHDSNWEEDNHHSNESNTNDSHRNTSEHGSGLANVLQSGKDVMPPPIVEPVLGDNPPIEQEEKLNEDQTSDNSTTDTDFDHKSIEGEKW